MKKGLKSDMYDGVVFLRGGKFVSKDKWRHITRAIESTELIIVLSGKINMFVNEEKLCITAGEVLRILPGEMHGGYEDSENVAFFWIHLTGAKLYELPKRVSRPENFERLQTVTRELLHYSKRNEYPKECADALTKVLLAEITHGKSDMKSELLSEIKGYIRRNREIPLKATDIAKKYNYNEDYLNKLFKKELGVGIKKYIDSVRVEAIKCDLIMSDMTLTEIAEAYGFDEYKYLLKFFKYHEGITPSDFRESFYVTYTNSKNE